MAQRKVLLVFIPEQDQVVMPKQGSVALYLDKLTDKLLTRKRTEVYLSDLSRPISDGGLGWSIPQHSRGVRPGDTSCDWQVTGLVTLVDGQSLADKLQREAEERGYGIVFYCVRERIYAAKSYPE